MIDINDKSSCTGCSACASICANHAITMTGDNEGFKYPSLNKELCVDCGLCNKVCPVERRDSLPSDRIIPKAYAAHYKNDDKIWYESASGGAFTAITDYVFKHNGIVYGACYNEKLEVCHDSADNPTEATKFRDSKYVQSDINDCYHRIKEDLNNNKLVLFSGTPCQVSGLKCFLRKDYANLLTVDLICHCVPSPRVYKDYLRYIENKYGKKVIKIHTKDKTLGWNKFQTPRIYFEDGSSIFNIEDSRLWEIIFYSHIAVRPSCHKCRFANLHREGDLTIGDFWGVEKQHPEYSVPNGASLILVNTDKGTKAFEEINKKLVYAESDVINALPDTLLYATTPHPKRQMFWVDYEKMRFRSLSNKYFGTGKLNGIKRKIRRLINIPYRIIKKIK